DTPFDFTRSIIVITSNVFAEGFIGTPLTILVEARKDISTGFPVGFSDNYIPVAVRGDGATANRIVRVMPEAFREGRLIAEVIHE
ncbi:MAG: hypothetical protein AAB299_08330, partial [Thermodesulfobacteriota bacterium]